MDTARIYLKNSIAIFLLSLIFVSFIVSGRHGKDYFSVQWMHLVIAGCALFAAYLGYKFVSVPLFLASASAFISSAIVGMNNYGFYYENPIWLRDQVAKNCSQALAGLLVISIICTNIKKKHIKPINLSILIISILNSFILIYEWYAVGLYAYTWGLLSHPGINGCFIAACYPIARELIDDRARPSVFMLYLVVTSLSLYVCYSMIPFGVLFVAMVSYEMSTMRDSALFDRLVVAGSCLAVALLPLFTLKNGNNAILSTSGRSELWMLHLRHWFNHGSHLFGFGQGSYYVLGPSLDVSNGNKLVTLWLHSDWLQVIYEQGIFGFVCVVLLFGHCLKRSYEKNRHVAFSGLMAFSAGAVFNFPVRFALPALFGAIMATQCLIVEGD